MLDILRDGGQCASLKFADDNQALWGTQVNGAPVIDLEQALSCDPGSAGFVVSIGKPSLRLDLCNRVRSRGHLLINAIHPSAVLEPSTKIGCGNTISPHAVINSNAELGDAVVVNTSSIVEHDCVVEDGVSIAPMVCVGGRVRLGRGAFLCIGAKVLPRIRVGAGAVIGAGAVVMADVPEETLVTGYPARPVKRIDASFDWTKVL